MGRHDQFLNALHRRLILVRAAEHLGWCILVGCGISLPLIFICAWQNQPPFPILIAIAILCVIAAIGWTIAAWPTKQSAAAEADEQLNLADLLTTTLRLRNSTLAGDLLTSAVFAMADATCANLSSSTVALNRVGLRGWGGIGLSAALILTLAVLPLQPRQSSASSFSLSPLLTAQPQGKNSAPFDRMQYASQEATAPSRSTESAGEDGTQLPAATSEARSQSEKQTAASSESRVVPGDGHEAAIATATPAASDSHQSSSHIGAASAGAQNLNPRVMGTAAGNAGGENGLTAAPASGFVSSQNQSPRSVPPWESSEWRAVRASANNSVNSGQVSPAYSDVIKDYFSQPFQNQ